MHNPTPDEIENDPELQDILEEISDEILDLQDRDPEDPYDDFLIDDEDSEDDDDEDVFERLSHSSRGEWHDEYD